MADQSKVLEAMASQLTAVAAGLEALRVQGAEQTAANAETADKLTEMQQRISQHDALLAGDGPSVLSTAAPVARPQDCEIRIPHGDASSSQPVSREECAAMITEALQQKVGPALQAAFSQVGAELVADQHARARGPHAQDPDGLDGEGPDVLTDRGGQA